jgi:Phospholipase B
MTKIQKVKNGLKYEKNGWVYVSIKGDAFERGLAYGQLIKEDMKKVMKTIDFLVYNDYGVNWSFFVDACKKYYCKKMKEQFPEFYEEMEGFAKGANMSVESVVAWNNYFTLTEGWWSTMPEEEAIALRGKNKPHASGVKEGGQQERCSAFIAVGDWTKDGKIVVAHNNFSNFADGQFAKYVVDIQPKNGNRMLMMGFPGWIWSGTDFFVTSAGIIGTETTIGGFTAYENNIPIACRIRQAMQYGKTLDDYERILLDGNSGDYANSWLFGDINNNEIMRIELGLKYHNTERTNNGYFIGFNAPYDPRIRNLECVNTGFDDLRRHQGARRVRLEQLMDQWKGKIDIQIAKNVLADHYDTYLNKENPCSRTCCSHYELDAREYMSDPSRPKPFQPRGALDGNVCDTDMAKKMGFSLRWGNSCGIPFLKNKFCDENPIWDYLRPYLEDRPEEPWTDFYITDAKTTTNKNKSKANKIMKSKKTRKLTKI